MSNHSIYHADSLTIARSIADVDAVLSLVRREADALRISTALTTAGNALRGCQSRLRAPQAREATSQARGRIAAFVTDPMSASVDALASVKAQLRQAKDDLRHQAQGIDA